jgi:hypothetical protein
VSGMFASGAAREGVGLSAEPTLQAVHRGQAVGLAPRSPRLVYHTGIKVVTPCSQE